MTIEEAVQRCDETKPNTYPTALKRYWLAQVESMLQKEVYDLHAPDAAVDGAIDVQNADPQTQLSAPAPYDALYVRYLQAQVDYANGELERYNGAAALFNGAYAAYANAYHRGHLPRRTLRAEVP